MQGHHTAVPGSEQRVGIEEGLGEVADAVAFVDAPGPPRILMEVHDVVDAAWGEDVVVAVDIADVVAVGVDAGLVRGDPLEGGAPGELVPVQLVKVQWEGEG